VFFPYFIGLSQVHVQYDSACGFNISNISPLAFTLGDRAPGHHTLLKFTSMLIGQHS